MNKLYIYHSHDYRTSRQDKAYWWFTSLKGDENDLYGALENEGDSVPLQTKRNCTNIKLDNKLKIS